MVGWSIDLHQRVGGRFVATMLPCNVIVQQHADDAVEVSAVDPVASMQAIENPALAEVAKEVRAKLRRVINGL